MEASQVKSLQLQSYLVLQSIYKHELSGRIDSPAVDNDVMAYVKIHQDISPCKDGYTIWRLARTSLADGLGYTPKRSSMGESAYGLAILCRLSTRDASQFQVERGCYPLCRKAGIRVFCAAAK